MGDNGQPLSPTGDGWNRQADGRFGVGNSGGIGNPHARQAAAFREAILAAVTPEDVQDIVRVLLAEAKTGNIHAAREVLDRLVGKSVAPVEVSTGEQWTWEDILERAQHHGDGRPDAR